MTKAPRPVPEPAELMKLAFAAKANARAWNRDAETFLKLKRWPRAYVFSTLALEEYGKAALCLCFGVVPRDVLPAAAFWEMLNGHLAKLIMAYQLVIFMQPDTIPEAMQALGRVVEEINESKKRGLYADFDDEGYVQQPSVIDQVTARNHVRAVCKILKTPGPLNDDSYLEWIAGPEDEFRQQATEWISAFIQSMIYVYEHDGDDGLLTFFQEQLQGMHDDRWDSLKAHRDALLSVMAEITES